MTIQMYSVRSIAIDAAKGKSTETASFCIAQIHGWRKSFEDWLKLVEQFRSAMQPELEGELVL